ncbi:MAG: hypothetical protein Q8865_10385, partial [Bacillota bacterium]|nr:hypothetical protein [Bacillota bacterium]
CKAMRDKDANGNGKSDEVPLVSSSWTGMLRAFCGAYGLMNKGTRHPYVDLDPKTKKLRFVPTAPEFRQQLEFIHKMYSEKLIDNDIFQSSSTITSSTLAKSSMNLVGGVIFTNLTPVTGDRQKDFVGIEEALKGPNGDKIWSCIRSHIVTKGAFTISKTNPYPEATARWMDYWYSEAGSRMFYLGVEGKSYFKDTDGKYKFKPELVKVPEGQNFDAVVSKITPYVGGNSPVLLLSNYFSGNEMEPVPSKAAKDLLKYAPEPWEYFINTNEEMERMSSLEADIISGYYNSVIPQFITGQKPLDDQNWNEYVAKYDKMGLSEYMDLYNKGYERYMKAK